MQNRFEKCLIEQCAPTLAGIKLGSLFNYNTENCEDLKKLILVWDKTLSEKNIRVQLMKERHSGGLVYVYRPALLSKLLLNKQISGFLHDLRYPSGDIACCIQELQQRFVDGVEFPHEIGIFLGYPLQDVRGFIENKGANFSLCGMWKVYDNKTLSEKLFAQYSKCKEIYSAKYKNGSNIYTLAVSA